TRGEVGCPAGGVLDESDIRRAAAGLFLRQPSPPPPRPPQEHVPCSTAPALASRRPCCFLGSGCRPPPGGRLPPPPLSPRLDVVPQALPVPQDGRGRASLLRRRLLAGTAARLCRTFPGPRPAPPGCPWC